MYNKIDNIVWYFAGGMVNKLTINNAKWLRLNQEKSDTITDEYNNLINSSKMLSLIIIDSEYFIIIKNACKIKVWKIGSNFLRRMIPILKSEADNIGYDPKTIHQRNIKLNKEIIQKKHFSKYYKINIKII